MTPKTLDELMAEYDAERIAEINRNDTPAARKMAAKKAIREKEREILMGLRDQNGDWIAADEPQDEDDDEDDQ